MREAVSCKPNLLISHLYFHIPFCHRICPYCSFYKHTPGGTDMGAFVAALLKELELHQQTIPLLPRTLYFGGGTPTALSETNLAMLLEGLTQRLDLTQLGEFSVEANPKTIGPTKARLLRDHGVTRVSLGVQAWDEATLRLLGRDHSPGEAEETYYELREAGLRSINIDQMFSIPGLSLETWRAGLERTVSLKPDHISCYNLTYEEDTEFLSRLRSRELDASEDRDAEHFYAAVDFLTASGFEHYETSNYARPGHRSRHNQSYWRGTDYLGLGPSAVSTHERTRWKNVPDTAGYIRQLSEGRIPATETEHLTESQWLIERVALELRTAEGLPRGRVHESLQRNLDHLIGEGLMEERDGRLILTRAGKPLVDRIAEALLP
jgi:oxygen-independent coproporphyrinogen III oxidase